jgi:hypothetical protein
LYTDLYWFVLLTDFYRCVTGSSPAAPRRGAFIMELARLSRCASRLARSVVPEPSWRASFFYMAQLSHLTMTPTDGIAELLGFACLSPFMLCRSRSSAWQWSKHAPGSLRTAFSFFPLHLCYFVLVDSVYVCFWIPHIFYSFSGCLPRHMCVFINCLLPFTEAHYFLLWQPLVELSLI